MPINLGAIGSFLQGAAPNLQAQQQQRQQQAQQAAVAKALQQYAAQQQQSQQASTPSGAPMPGAAPMGAARAGNQAAPQGFGGGLPPIDQMMTALSKSGLSPDQQYEALQKYGAFASPIEKYTQQLNTAQEKMAMANQMLDEKMKNAVLLQQMRGDISSSNTDKRINAQGGAGASKQSIDSLKDQYNQTESDYRTALNNPQIKPEAFAELKAARDSAKAAYQQATKQGKAPSTDKTAPDSPPTGKIPPPEAIAALKAAPDTASQFDEIFGAGAAKKALGQ